MTVVPHRPGPIGWLQRSGDSAKSAWPAKLPRVQRITPTPEPDARTVVVSSALTLLSVLLFVFLLNLTVISQLQHWNSQRTLYDQLRLTLAEGSVPIGQLDVNGRLVASGTPVALLRIPRLGVKEVIVEGTSSQTTKLGVGHRRDTPLPGQPGVSVLMGRGSAYGAPLRDIGQLRKGETFSITTGQGTFEYQVIGPRVGKTTQLPALQPGDGRLTLITSQGRLFQPSGVLRVDAQLVSESKPRPAVAIAPGVVDPVDEVMAGDPERAFSLSWLAELLLGLSLAAVWSWKRWNRRATWLVFAPAITVTALACADRVTDLLPNLL